MPTTSADAAAVIDTLLAQLDQILADLHAYQRMYLRDPAIPDAQRHQAIVAGVVAWRHRVATACPRMCR